MTNPIKLLLLEDDPLDAELNITALEAEGYKCEWKRVQTKDEFIGALEKPDYDIIFIDYNLPAFDGMSALYILGEHELDIPALLVSGNLGEELAIDSMKAGAVDYVHKDRLNRLVPSVKRALKESELRRTERVQANNLSLFNKLNQAANSGASIDALIEILAIETSNYANYFGATTFLLNEEKEYFEMQHLALPADMRHKVEKIIVQMFYPIRIPANALRIMREVVENKEIKVIDTEKEIEQFLSEIIKISAPKTFPKSLDKFSSLIRKTFHLSVIGFLPLVIKKQEMGILVFPYKESIFSHDIQQMEAIAEQLTEIFARKIAEEEVEKLQHQQKLILDSADEGIVGINMEGRLIFANPSAALMLGQSEEEMRGKDSHAVFRPKNNAGRVYGKEECPVFATYTLGENIYEEKAEFWHKDSGYFPVLFSSMVIDEEGERIGAVITFRDISKQVEATREIARLAEVVEQASVTVAITDLEGNLVYANPFFEKSSGYGVDEVLGGNPRILKSGIQDKDTYKDLWETIKKGETWHNTLVNKRKDGSLYYEDANIFPVKTSEGEIINFATVKRDITAQVEAEEEILLQLSRLDSLHSIDSEILSNSDLKAILDVVLAQVKKGLGDAASILLYNPSLNSLEYATQLGFNTDKPVYKFLRLGKGLAGKIALEQKPNFIQNLSKERESLAEMPLLPAENFHSYFGFPLLSQGKLKGVLEVFYREPVTSDEVQSKFLGMLAGQAAIAIDNITLFEELERNNMELRLAYISTLEGWARALELRDLETLNHSRRVTRLTVDLSSVMGINAEKIEDIRRGALLHDIGKIGVSDVIFKKAGALNKEEWAAMKQHPLFAYEMLKDIDYLKPALDIPYCHHEKWDGSGYPQGLKGEEIPQPARIFALVDVYDALTNWRPYRKNTWSKKEALAYIQEQSGKHFDPKITDVFIKMMEESDEV